MNECVRCACEAPEGKLLCRVCTDQLLGYIKADQPWLGYATTGRLIEELAARAEVDSGEAWTQYRTVDSH